MPDIGIADHQSICDSLNIRPAEPEFTEFHFSTKSGPNGPAMATSPLDLASLPHETIDDIISIGGDLLGSYVKKCTMRTPLKGLSFLEL